MLVQRFLRIGLDFPKFWAKNWLLSKDRQILGLYGSFQLRANGSYIMAHPLLQSPYFSFSNSKKASSKSGQRQVHKILKTQMQTNENGERYLVLYDAQKQQNSFRVISVLLLFFFSLTMVKIYHEESHERRDDYIILGIIAFSFYIYQRRILKTMKKMTLNSNGDKVRITSFLALGKGERVLQTPVELMAGYGRASKIGGYVLQAGGKYTNFVEQRFLFSTRFITHRTTFDYISQGKKPKIVDQFTSL